MFRFVPNCGHPPGSAWTFGEGCRTVLPRVHVKGVALILALAAGLGAAGCSRQETPPPAAAEAREPAAQAQLPKIGGTEGYVGSKACQDCHKDQHARWHRSYHRTMTQFARGEAVQADFNNVVLTNAGTRYTLQRRGEEHWVRMEPSAAGAATGEFHEAPVSLVTGSHHMQVFWVPEGHGNLQVGFPFTWLIPEKRWVPRDSTFIRPPGGEHRPEAWNIVCSRCHTTGVEPHADMAARRIDTQVAELGISCEACHGPGQRHAELQNIAKLAGARSPLQAGEIVHPETLTAERSAQVCGFCHSMKWIDRAENWRETGFRYRPGDDLQATTPVIRPNRVGDIQGLEAYLQRHPDLLRDFFWPDGMVRVSGREYNGLIESPCYKGGKFSCISCHSLHDSEPDDQLRPIARGSAACVQCHAKYGDDREVALHTRHLPGSSGSECYNCHMPHTTYGVLKAIRSHEVSSPRVADELATGRPNACNLCHLDRTLDWTAQTLARWFGHALPPLPHRGEAVPRAARLAVAGDAGQRALLAWHFGWGPAVSASPNHDAVAVLAQLLDDPYAAIRCVAERSLKTVAPGLLPARYDYTVEPANRTSARDAVWSAWRASPPGAAIPTGGAPRAESTKESLEALSRTRNEAPVRLRE